MNKDIPTEVLQGELESLKQALIERSEITLRQDDEFYTLKLSMGTRWRSESSARFFSETIWTKILEPLILLHLDHIKEELERRAATSSENAPPG